ncbi:PAAR domain-containing protein [Variovorax dokdonensis]|uniref:PAAR domain-containing protein n=1 Tax=Variovorax dokdonensis TaxID=344883 RepID=A0ABT7NAC2_9BURK|nr:PAAR domain-containing protein [Variovorax dokdonensis]MDM0044896.1 PAAR domain-containing protein [Variovorax dokdonensis]
MKDEKGRGVIRKGDKTDHGGVVTTSLPGLDAMGIEVAGEDCIAKCPKCKGEFRLVPAGPRRHMGKLLAYDGDKTECGAKLISSI